METTEKGPKHRIIEEFSIGPVLADQLREHPYGKRSRGNARDRLLHRHSQVQEAHELLNEVQFTVLVAFELADMPYKDIEKDLGIPMGTIKSALNRARKRILANRK